MIEWLTYGVELHRWFVLVAGGLLIYYGIRGLVMIAKAFIDR